MPLDMIIDFVETEDRRREISPDRRVARERYKLMTRPILPMVIVPCSSPFVSVSPCAGSQVISPNVDTVPPTLLVIEDAVFQSI
jgi:hypothetical protein